MSLVHSIRALLLAGILIVTGCGDSQTESEVPSSAPDSTPSTAPWTGSEMALLESLSIAALRPVPPQPSNRVSDDPEAALELADRLALGVGRRCHLLPLTALQLPVQLDAPVAVVERGPGGAVGRRTLL